jgi:hypothetical protein
MERNDYKAGDQVRVKMNNPRNENKEEWRDGEVLDVRMVYPKSPERHKPYPIVIVRVRRTYCKATPTYRFIGNIPIFVDNTLEFYERENDEGFIYDNTIMLKDTRTVDEVFEDMRKSFYTVPEEFKKL